MTEQMQILHQSAVWWSEGWVMTDVPQNGNLCGFILL